MSCPETYLLEKRKYLVLTLLRFEDRSLSKINNIYSCNRNYRVLMSVWVSVCVCQSFCMSVCVHDNSKNNGSIHLKLEHIVVYENSLNEFDIGHCLIKVKVHLTQYKLSSPISQLWHVRKL